VIPYWAKTTAITVIPVLLWTSGLDAQEEIELPGFANIQEPNFVLEIGPAAEWPLHGERANYGGNIALAKEAIETWLELEFGVTGLATSGRGE
jgi:hypothetical protein